MGDMAGMEFINQRICMGKDLGIHGNLFGGIMLSWIDEAGTTLAAKVCHSPHMVTLKIDEVIFEKAVKIGFHIRIYGKAVDMGRSSITLMLEARKYDVATEQEVLVTQTKMKFVQIEKSGTPMPISQKARNRFFASKTQ